MVKERQPSVSLIILFYNQEDYVKSALDGVFSQNYENIEIIISDDASVDGTFTAVEHYLKEHDGERRVYVNRNKKNMGLVPHLNYLIENYAHGELIALAGGDDISMPNRIEDTVDLFNYSSNIMAVTGQTLRIDKEGNVKHDAPESAVKEGVYGIDDDYIRSFSFMRGGYGLAIRREVWDSFGALLPECPTEDSTFRFRALLEGEMAVSPNVFIKYRIHGNNLSAPENVFKLKTNGIIAQYRKDLLIARDNEFISINLAKRLEKKIYLYGMERRLAAAKYGKPRLLRAPYKFVQNILTYLIEQI